MPKNTGNAESPRRSTGSVIEEGTGYLPNGKPDLSPAAGYEGHEPVRYSDENDEQFAGRVAQFESARATALDIQNAAGMTQDSYEAKKQVIETQYQADLKALDKERERREALRDAK